MDRCFYSRETLVRSGYKYYKTHEGDSSWNMDIFNMLWDTVYGCLLVYSILCIHTQQHVTRSQKWGLTFETGSKSLDLVGSALAQILRPKFCSRCSMACHASYIMICLQTLCNSHTWRGDGKLRQEVFFFFCGGWCTCPFHWQDWARNTWLVGGLEHLLFFHILGIIISTD